MLAGGGLTQARHDGRFHQLTVCQSMSQPVYRTQELQEAHLHQNRPDHSGLVRHPPLHPMTTAPLSSQVVRSWILISCHDSSATAAPPTASNAGSPLSICLWGHAGTPEVCGEVHRHQIPWRGPPMHVVPVAISNATPPSISPSTYARTPGGCSAAHRHQTPSRGPPKYIVPTTILNMTPLFLTHAWSSGVCDRSYHTGPLGLGPVHHAAAWPEVNDDHCASLTTTTTKSGVDGGLCWTGKGPTTART